MPLKQNNDQLEPSVQNGRRHKLLTYIFTAGWTYNGENWPPTLNYNKFEGDATSPAVYWVVNVRLCFNSKGVLIETNYDWAGGFFNLVALP